MIQRFKGVSAISEFKRKKLLDRLKKIQPGIINVSAEFIHFVDSEKAISGPDERILINLLEYDMPYEGDRQGEFFLAVPRPGTISPWSSKAISIAHDSGLSLNRIERGTAYYIDSSESLDRQKISSLLHDRMTESMFNDLNSADLLFKKHRPEGLLRVDLLGKGRKALEEADKSMGLALSDEEIEYLCESYKSINRNPTDLELMMFGVVNSEHCRHKIFNADWFIDEEKQPKSLFKMIKNTYEKHPQGIISAYSDNSAILSGFKEKTLELNPDTHEYEENPQQTHLVVKVETHNHPTAIAPFPGAATGSGGEIRDENATGRGAKAKMGLTGFSVSNLRIPGYIQPWEKTDIKKPETISSALDIMIKAPLGGASFNNEFGRPNTAGYFRTYESQIGSKPDDYWGYHKPIMIAGGLGSIKDSNKAKKKLSVGNKLIVLGGPAMLIGLAGGAASSMESGQSSAELDFASVQRGNAEMQRRAFEVINNCASSDDNPIISIHDVGAGGLSNALTELVHDSGLGAKFELRSIDSAEEGLSPMEIWCNEAQERYVLAIDDNDLERFSRICEREKCPYSIVGETTSEERLVINDSLFNERPADIPMSLLFGGPPKITKKVDSVAQENKKINTSKIEIKEALYRVLRVPAVASKKFLITIGDRTVGGLIARDQMVGPWQVPVSDVAVSATGYFSSSGEAMSMGERTPIATINAPASARMAIGESITNIACASIEKISGVKLSANWMAASGYESEDYNLFQTVKAVGEEFCPSLGLTIPVGKDSLSMRTIWQENNRQKSVTSPVSLIISAFAPVKDVGVTLTPQLKKIKDSKLIFIDLSGGRARLGASALAQAYNLSGGDVPDVDNPKIIAKFFECVQDLNSKGLVEAYHDRSDGGLAATLLEMSFAGRAGIDIDLSSLPGTSLEKLFNEELGAVIQISAKNLSKALGTLNRHLRNAYYEIGSVSENSLITIIDAGKTIISENRANLEYAWAETSYQLQRIRDDEKSAENEFNLIKDDNDPGISPKITFDTSRKTCKNKPKVAILREQGVNGQNEMAGAFTMAGFKAVDVSTKDLLDRRTSLEGFSGIAVCGGFSYGDVLGAGLGWAKEILANKELSDEFKRFFERKDTFSLGVCNGCQMLSGLKSIIPGTAHWPKFLKNTSEQFEARVSSVKINKSSSLFFKGMEGSVLPVPVAHGEGRAVFSDNHMKESLDKNLVPLQFVDNYHKVTQAYPLNPNGSLQGITALSSADGRSLIMMPHPERAFLTYQHSWHPDEWPTHGPWLKIFENARQWVDSQ